MPTYDGKLSPVGNIQTKVTFVGPWYRRLYKYAELEANRVLEAMRVK